MRAMVKRVVAIPGYHSFSQLPFFKLLDYHLCRCATLHLSAALAPSSAA